MKEIMNKNYVFDKLVKEATKRNIVGYPDYQKIQDALDNGKPIPDKCLPGRLVLELTEEERKMLSQLKENDIQHRIN